RAFRSRGRRRVRGVAAGDRPRCPEGARRAALGPGSPHPHDRRRRHGRAASRRQLVSPLGRRRGPRPPRGEGVKDISPQLQNQIAQYQQLQNQLQVLGSQRVQLDAKLREIEGTLEERGKIKDDTPVYKSIGMLLVKQDDRKALKKDVEEHKESLTRFLMIFLFLLALYAIIDPAVGTAFAAFANVVLFPMFGFGGLLPVLTILLAGLLTTTIGSIIRDRYTNWVKMARTQKVMAA